MDYEKLKSEISAIAEIAGQVPEAFRAKCFEILLNHLLAAERTHQELPATPPAPTQNAPIQAPAPSLPTSSSFPLSAQTRVFMQRTGVTKEELERVVLIDGDEVHFVREPAHGTVAKGQMEWALLLALRHALVANEFSTDPEDVRSICQEKGFYDKTNFATVFKREPYASYFRQPLQPQGARQALTSDGQAALGQLVKGLSRTGE